MIPLAVICAFLFACYVLDGGLRRRALRKMWSKPDAQGGVMCLVSIKGRADPVRWLFGEDKRTLYALQLYGQQMIDKETLLKFLNE